MSREIYSKDNLTLHAVDTPHSSAMLSATDVLVLTCTEHVIAKRHIAESTQYKPRPIILKQHQYILLSSSGPDPPGPALRMVA